MEVTRSYDPKELSQRDMHGLLLSAVAPRPICLASTVDTMSNVNLSPFSFFNVFSSNPPVLVFSPANSGTGGREKDTLQNVKQVPECVVNIVNYAIAEQMSLSSTGYARGVNEFSKSGLTEVQSDIIRPPRVGEAPVSMECKVTDVIPLGHQGGSGNLVICEMVRMHVHEKYLNHEGHLDTTKLDLVSRMGGNWYSRAIPESLFEISKPLKTFGVGVDKLPGHVRDSEILSGNDLGKLGNMDRLPSPEDIDAFFKKFNGRLELSKEEVEKGKVELSIVHTQAKKLIAEGDAFSALVLLTSYQGG